LAAAPLIFLMIRHQCQAVQQAHRLRDLIRHAESLDPPPR
jgi:hypothetical protein